MLPRGAERPPARSGRIRPATRGWAFTIWRGTSGSGRAATTTAERLSAGARGTPSLPSSSARAAASGTTRRAPYLGGVKQRAGDLSRADAGGALPSRRSGALAEHCLPVSPPCVRVVSWVGARQRNTPYQTKIAVVLPMLSTRIIPSQRIFCAGPCSSLPHRAVKGCTICRARRVLLGQPEFFKLLGAAWLFCCAPMRCPQSASALALRCGGGPPPTMPRPPRTTSRGGVHPAITAVMLSLWQGLRGSRRGAAMLTRRQFVRIGAAAAAAPFCSRAQAKGFASYRGAVVIDALGSPRAPDDLAPWGPLI